MIEEQEKPKRRLLGLWVSAKEHEDFVKRATSYGYDTSSLLRLLIYGNVKGIRLTRKPSVDMILLGDIIGKLTALIGEVNKLGSNINQIAKRLNQGSRDLFGLDSCLRLFEGIGQKTLQTLIIVENAITGRSQNHNEEGEE